MSKQNMKDSKKHLLRYHNFSADINAMIKVKIEEGIATLPHDPQFILIIDQAIDAGNAYTKGVVKLATIDGVGDLPVDEAREVSLKLKKINLDMLVYLLSLYAEIDQISEDMPDEQYQEELDKIVWEFPIDTVFDFELAS